MERKIEIPKMSDYEISFWYKTIKPIVYDEMGEKRYLRELSPDELKEAAFTWLDNPEDYSAKVDYSKLSVLEDRVMYLSFGYYALFKPKVSEVIRQIPKDYLKKVVSFEVIHSSIGFSKEVPNSLSNMCRRCIVRLYQAKSETNDVATPVEEYPTIDSKLPVGMAKEEFEELIMEAISCN